MQTTRFFLLGAVALALASSCLLATPQAQAATTSTEPTLPTTSTLIVVKQVINDDGHAKTAGDFSLSVTDGASATQDFTGSSDGTSLIIAPGKYSVTETEDADYATSYSSDCSGSITAGEFKTCTVTNDDIAPPFVATTGTLMVVKRVINDDGGTAQANDFTLFVSYQDGDGTSTQSFAGDVAGTSITLEAGKYYEVTEGENSYTNTFSADCSGTLEVGKTKTCTVTNDDALSENLSKITIIKHVVNRYDGTKRAGDFTLRLDYQAPVAQDEVRPAVEASATSTATFPGSEDGTSFVIAPGRYQVSEGDHQGYDVSYSAGCSGIMSGGEQTVCTVTNADIEVSHGGPGWSPGILEPFDLYNPQSNNRSGGSGSTGGTDADNGGGDTGQNSTSTGAQTVGRISSYPLGTCSITEPEAYYITPDIERLLAYTGQGRDLSMEDWFNRTLVSRVATGTDSVTLAAVQNFIDYGTFSNLRLGQGERAGVVASYQDAYGHLPADTCDWQEVVRLADTKQPTRLVSRDLAMVQPFADTYRREQQPRNMTDAIAQSLMAYGVRPQTRDIDAEHLALGAFQRTFGRLPISTQDWDINRALAYSGLAQRWLPSSLALSQSRIMSIGGLDAAFALVR